MSKFLLTIFACSTLFAMDQQPDFNTLFSLTEDEALLKMPDGLCAFDDKYLLKPDEHGRTPFHRAIVERKYRLAIHFIDDKSTVLSLEDNQNQTPLNSAIKNGDKDMVNLLRDLGSNLVQANIIDAKNIDDSREIIEIHDDRDESSLKPPKKRQKTTRQELDQRYIREPVLLFDFTGKALSDMQQGLVSIDDESRVLSIIKDIDNEKEIIEINDDRDESSLKPPKKKQKTHIPAIDAEFCTSCEKQLTKNNRYFLKVKGVKIGMCRACKDRGNANGLCEVCNYAFYKKDRICAGKCARLLQTR